MPRVALRSSAITLIVLLSLNWSLATAQADTPKVDFSHDIAPIIRARCAECHTDGTYKGSFSLDTRAAMLESEAVVPGKPDQSELLARVTSHDPEERMPPPEKKPLAAREVELLRRWVAEGAAWQEGYSFKRETYVAPLKPRRVMVPPARPGLEHPIDRILAPYYASHQVTPPSELDDAAFLRRLDLDFIGLLPAPDELAAFQRDTSPGKRNRQVRSALDDRRAYADHWFTFWNDMLRNEQGGIGTRENGRKPVSAWLYQALLDNKPYDVFARELLSPTPDSEGFIHGIQWRGRVNASQTRDVQFSQNVSQVFFGINMKCASCHDSFIDTWKLADAYGLAAITAEKPLEIYRCDHPTGKMAEARFLWPELGSIDPSAPRAKRLEQLAALTTHPDNGRFQRTIVNRIWQRLMGRGIVQPVDVMANRPWNEDLLDYLAGYLVEQHYDLQKLLEHIATSRAYQSQAAIYDEEPAAADFVFHGPELKRMTAEQFLDAISMITGTAPAKKLFPVKQPAASRKDRDFLRSSLVALDPLLRSLGRPNREQIVTTRPDQLTTLQALDLTNGQILSEMLARGAANLLKSDPQVTGSAMIDTIYDRALSRRPTHDEQATALEIVGEKPTTESLSDLLWAVFMLPEFQLIR